MNTKMVNKILSYYPYYDDIINYDIKYDDEFSFDIIDWYKDLIFSINYNDNNEIEVVKKIDRCMYIYVNSLRYRNGLKRIINIYDIDLNSDRKKRKLIKKIINYTSKYEDELIYDFCNNKWI